jgi:hypothetical protein
LFDRSFFSAITPRGGAPGTRHPTPDTRHPTTHCASAANTRCMCIQPGRFTMVARDKDGPLLSEETLFTFWDLTRSFGRLGSQRSFSPVAPLDRAHTSTGCLSKIETLPGEGMYCTAHCRTRAIVFSQSGYSIDKEPSPRCPSAAEHAASHLHPSTGPSLPPHATWLFLLHHGSLEGFSRRVLTRRTPCSPLSAVNF